MSDRIDRAIEAAEVAWRGGGDSDSDRARAMAKEIVAALVRPLETQAAALRVALRGNAVGLRDLDVLIAQLAARDARLEDLMADALNAVEREAAQRERAEKAERERDDALLGLSQAQAVYQEQLRDIERRTRDVCDRTERERNEQRSKVERLRAQLDEAMALLREAQFRNHDARSHKEEPAWNERLAKLEEEVKR